MCRFLCPNCRLLRKGAHSPTATYSGSRPSDGHDPYRIPAGAGLHASGRHYFPPLPPVEHQRMPGGAPNGFRRTAGIERPRCGISARRGTRTARAVRNIAKTEYRSGQKSFAPSAAHLRRGKGVMRRAEGVARRTRVLQTCTKNRRAPAQRSRSPLCALSRL